MTRSSNLPSAGPGCRACCDASGRRDPPAAATSIVVLAEGGSDVDEPGAVLGGDEVAGENRVGVAGQFAELEDRARVVAAHQLAPAAALDDLSPLAEHPLDQGLGDDQRLAAEPRLDVGDLGRNRNGEVAGQRPGGRRPDQERLPASAPPPRASGKRT